MAAPWCCTFLFIQLMRVYSGAVVDFCSNCFSHGFSVHVYFSSCFLCGRAHLRIFEGCGHEFSCVFPENRTHFLLTVKMNHWIAAMRPTTTDFWLQNCRVVYEPYPPFYTWTPLIFEPSASAPLKISRDFIFKKNSIKHIFIFVFFILVY